MLTQSSSHQAKGPTHPRSPRSRLPRLKIDAEDVDLAVGLGSAAFSVDQIIKAARSRRHKTSHYVKAGLASMLSASAFAMMAQDRSPSSASSRHMQGEKHKHKRSPSPSPPRHRLRLRSASSPDLPRFGRAGEDYARDPREYFSDDESETSLPHGRRPRLPYHEPEERHEHDEHEHGKGRRRHSFGIFEERKRSLSPEAAVRRRRRELHHRSPSPSPPRYRGVSVG